MARGKTLSVVFKSNHQHQVMLPNNINHVLPELYKWLYLTGKMRSYFGKDQIQEKHSTTIIDY